MTRPQVIEAVGEPSRIDKLGDYAVWYYDLKRVRDANYSLRVAFADDLVCQAYVGFDLADGPAG